MRTLVTPDEGPDLLAVLAEALSNATKHADASRIDIVVTAGEELQLVVADDGKGLRGDVVESGLTNLRQRAERHLGPLRGRVLARCRDEAPLGGADQLRVTALRPERSAAAWIRATSAR